MKFAYADPPYYGLAQRFYGKHHPDASRYDTLEAHFDLIGRLCDEFEDGWALSLGSKNLRDILPICPPGARVGAWVKPFASFKTGIGVAYAWEPVIFMGGRRRPKNADTTRDWCSVNMAMKTGFKTAKPEGLIFWVLDVLHARPDDEIHDLFPGSGAVTRAIEKWRRQWSPSLFATQPKQEVIPYGSDPAIDHGRHDPRRPAHLGLSPGRKGQDLSDRGPA